MSNSKKPKKAIDPNIVEAPMETSSDELVAEVVEEVKEVKAEAPKIVEAAEEPVKEEAPAPVEEVKEEPKKEEAPVVEEKKPEPVKEEVKKEEPAPAPVKEEPKKEEVPVKEEPKKEEPNANDINVNDKFMLVVVASKVNPADKIVAKIMANKKVAEIINVNEIVVDDNNEKVVVFTTDDKKAAVQMQKRLVGCGVKTSIEAK